MDYVYESQPTIIDQDKRITFKIALTGVVLGLVGYIITYTLERFILASLVCHGESSCTTANSYAGNIASVLIGIIGVVALVRSGVYRPIIIAIGAAISLWGVSSWLFNAGVVVSLIGAAGLYGIAYLTYGWLVRIRNVALMLIVCALVAAASVVVPILIK